MIDGNVNITEYLQLVAPLVPVQHETRVPGIIACVSICMASSFIILVLRGVGRYFSGIRVARHDWLVALGWIFLICQAGTLWGMARHGIGRHIIVVTKKSDARILQVLNLCNEMSYFLCLGFIKLSITNMYTSIFPCRVFGRWCLGVTVFTICWMITGVLTMVFMCNPPKKSWDPFEEGTCIDLQMFLAATSALNIATDLVLLILPMPMVAKLQLSRQKKTMVMMTFSVGGLACAASIIRFYLLMRFRTTFDATWTSTYLLEVSTAELTITFLCACLPTYRPIYRRCFYRSLDSTRRSSQQQRESTLFRNDISADAYSVNVSSNPRRMSGMKKPGVSIMQDIALTTADARPESQTRLADRDEMDMTEMRPTSHDAASSSRTLTPS